MLRHICAFLCNWPFFQFEYDAADAINHNIITQSPCLLTKSRPIYSQVPHHSLHALQDIKAREEGKPEKDVGLEALTYIGASLSLIGLTLTVLTLLASKYVGNLNPYMIVHISIASYTGFYHLQYGALGTKCYNVVV